MLCVITVVAVVFVHKESTVMHRTLVKNYSQPCKAPTDQAKPDPMGTRQADSLAEAHHPVLEGNWNEAEMEVELLQQTHKRHHLSNRPHRRRHDETAPVIVMLQGLPDNADPADVVEDGHTYDPALNKTLEPHLANLESAAVRPIIDVDPGVVGEAQKKADEALAAGKDEATAYRIAQDVASKKVTSEAATRGDAPAFSRTMRAAAYAAEKRAEKLLIEGKSPEEVRKAATEAAQLLVSDKRRVESAVPVRNTLARMLNQVNSQWLHLEKKLASLKAELSTVPEGTCSGVMAGANHSHHEMQIALIQASRHIHQSTVSKKAMDAHLAAAQDHESHAASLLQFSAEKTARMKLATDSKVQSALHHEEAKKHAMLAQGFLAVATKHHDAASQVALQCKAKAILADYEYAERAKESYRELTAKRYAEAAAKRAAEKSVKAKAKAKKEQHEKAQAKEAKAKSEKKSKISERKEKGDALDPNDRNAYTTEIAEKHLTFTKQMQRWVQAMQTDLPKQMKVAANQALLATHGSEKQLSSAAEQACSSAIKVAAKKLASKMKQLSPKKDQDKVALMKKAIITVLKVGRPMQDKIVASAVKSFLVTASTMVSTKTSIKSKVDARSALKVAVKKATAKAASEAQKRVAAAGGTADQQLKAAAVAAATASKMAATAFKLNLKRLADQKTASLAKKAKMSKYQKSNLLEDAKTMVLGGH